MTYNWNSGGHDGRKGSKRIGEGASVRQNDDPTDLMESTSASVEPRACFTFELVLQERLDPVGGTVENRALPFAQCTGEHLERLSTLDWYLRSR